VGEQPVDRAIRAAARLSLRSGGVRSIGATNNPAPWHRGFPIQLVNARVYSDRAETTEIVLIQADFCNGDMDIDAVCRMIHRPQSRFDRADFPLTSRTVAPFNSQNTFNHASPNADYFIFPGSAVAAFLDPTSAPPSENTLQVNDIQAVWRFRHHIR
jgi:hypothetical protein